MPLATSFSHPAVITRDYQNSAIDKCISSVDKPLSLHEKPSRFEEHTSMSFQPFTDSTQKPQHKLSPSLMPIYHSEPFDPIYNNYYVRSHEPQSYAIKPNDEVNTIESANRIGYTSIPKDMQRIHIGHNQSIHDRNPIQLYENSAPSLGQRPINNSQFPFHLNKSQPLGHQQYYSPVESINTAI